MRTAFLTAALLVGFAAPSFAQNQGQNGNYEQPQRGMNMSGGDESGPMNIMGGMNGRQMGPMMQAARELAAGAFFRFKRGNDEVDIHCPPNVALQNCVGAAADLMGTLRRVASGSGESGSGESGGGQSGNQSSGSGSQK